MGNKKILIGVGFLLIILSGVVLYVVELNKRPVSPYDTSFGEPLRYNVR